MKSSTIVKILGAESLGVRSFAAYIETPDIKILLDPGCALGPTSKAPIPHPIEYERLIKKTNELICTSKVVDIIIISHYHNDHFKNFITDYDYIYTDPEIAASLYSNKTIFIKDPGNFINTSQRGRARVFLHHAKKICEKSMVSDNNSFMFGNTRIDFSRPVLHGEQDSKRGWVVMTTVINNNNDEILTFTSDIQGPLVSDTLDLILTIKPDRLFLDGPALNKNEQMSINYLASLYDNIDSIIVDHHLLRSLHWKTWLETTIGANIQNISCAADYNKEEMAQLEAKRRELYNSYPESQEFSDWAALTANERKSQKPPL